VLGAEEGVEFEIREFPCFFECSRVLNLAINAHEIICLEPLGETVTAEVADIWLDQSP
jgi:hypothetical protein